MKEYTADTGAPLPEIDPACYAPDTQPLALTLDNEFAHIPLAQLVASLTNPRTTFNQVKLQELADSIRAGGVHQPVLVRRLPGARVADTDRKVQYEIVAGERRFRACQLAGVATIPAMVRAMTDREVLEVQIIENLQRDDLSELEEAEGYGRLMQHSTLTADAVGNKIGKSRSYVYARLKLLELCPEARAVLRDGTIDASRALLLARLPDHKLQLKALEYVRRKFNGDFELSYRSAAAYIQRDYMLRLDRARFDITDAALVPGATACAICPKRTGHEPELFADVDSPDVCTAPDCYRSKQDAHDARQLQQAHERGQTVITGREARALWPNGWSGIEGYLRLDNPEDSPTSKPLRSMLARQIEDAGIKPVLLANPHSDKGELVAMLPSTTVAELLMAQGHKEEAGQIDGQLSDKKQQKSAAEKANLKREFEQGWRTELMKRTWEKLSQADQGCGVNILSSNALRHIATGFIEELNGDGARRLCGLLDLGKVAPKQALIDLAAEHEDPEQLILLLIMHKDLEYRSWLPDDYAANAGLMLVAKDFEMDVEAIKADVKNGIKAKLKAEKKLSADPISPALHPKGGAGGNASTARPAAPARKPKLSAAEAQLGIAEAMQQMGGGQAAAAGSCLQDDHACAAPAPQNEGQEGIQEGAKPGRILGTLKLPKRAADTVQQVAEFSVGQRVRFREGLKGPAGILRKVCGRIGTIQEINGEQYVVLVDVIFVPTHKAAGKHFAAANELELADVQAAPVQGGLPVGVALGQRVRVLPSCRNPRQQKWVGKEGTVSLKVNDEIYDVTFKGRNGGVAGFHVTELEVVS